MLDPVQFIILPRVEDPVVSSGGSTVCCWPEMARVDDEELAVF
jgi:hypothetical protein